MVLFVASTKTAATILGIARTMSTSPTQSAGPLEKLIRQRIQEKYAPVQLEIKNESHKHRHHAPMQGVSSTETHFHVRVVSDEFAGLTLLTRQRGIYELLKDEMQREGGIHALSLVTKTPKEVEIVDEILTEQV
ncbi:BolA domain UV induced protein Uvi31 [Kickxella alabastrina]|uniref:BolA domain UV induced protein Uvi31 n=1 Tax=Kickxella alabastrina TaxID=61397 RepID=A0ACC1IB62_9FUNG|nr:BolA domain UV induced protein Uvi31 [Kickxella alabastrina]